MNIVNRHHKIREITNLGIGMPYILTRPRAQWDSFLTPTSEGGEWERSRTTGIWRTIRSILHSEAGLLNLRRTHPIQTIGVRFPGGFSGANHALDSAYTAGSAGDGVSYNILIQESLTINKVYANILSYGGTAGNVDDIECEIRSSSGTTGVNTAGGGLLEAAQQIDPGGTTGWKVFSGFSSALTAGAYYHFIIRDANGNSTDFARILYGSISLETFPTFFINRPIVTANGFTTLSFGEIPIAVLVFSDGSSWGFPFTATSLITSSTLDRGLKIGGGLPNGIKIHGMGIDTTANLSSLRFWEGDSGPGGSPAASGTAAFYNATATLKGACFADPLPTTTANETCRITFKLSGNDGRPQTFDIGTGANAELRAAMIGGGNWCYTQDSSGAWSDSSDSLLQFALFVDDFVDNTPAGGGLLSHPGMSGGLSA